MKTTHAPIAIFSACALAGALAAGTLAFGCDAGPSNAPAQSTTAEAGGAPALTYDALLELLGNPDPFERARQLGELLPKLGRDSLRPVKLILKMTSQAEIELGAGDHELLIAYWARFEPAEASNYAMGASPRGYRVGAIYASVRPWVEADPQAAVAKLLPWTRMEGDWGAAVQIAIARGWYDSGKPGFEEYITDLGATFERQRAISTYLVSMAHDRGPDAVIEWAEAHLDRDKSFQLDTFRGAGSALIVVDPKAAQRFCDAHCDKPYGDNVRTAIATRWVEVGDPPDAFTWLAKQPMNQETELAVRRSFVIWADLDRRAALDWMKPRVDSGTEKWFAPALPIYIRIRGREAPEEILALIPRYFEGAEREFWNVEVLRYWRQTDEPAAEAWLSKSTLPAETLAKVREPQTDYERLVIKQQAEMKQLEANRARLDS